MNDNGESKRQTTTESIIDETPGRPSILDNSVSDPNIGDSNSQCTATNEHNIDEINCSQSGSGSDNKKLVSNWNYQKGLLQHIVNKTRATFLSSDDVNEFPQCTWFEEDDLLFGDTMIECSAKVNEQCIMVDIQILKKTISDSLAELNEIVGRLIGLIE